MKPDVMKDEANALIKSRPYHQWLGIEVISVSEGQIEITARWREEWVVNPDRNYIHGGILAALVDLGADWSFYFHTRQGVPTIDLRVDYHAPARGNLRVVGTVLKYGQRISSAEAKVFDSDGQLVASGRGTFQTGK